MAKLAEPQGKNRVRKAWIAVKPFILSVLGVLVFMLAVVGLPLAAVVVLFFHWWLFRSTRPGKLGLEDVMGVLLRLSAICGLVMALLIALGLLLDLWVASHR
jgi:hypothetical protein